MTDHTIDVRHLGRVHAVAVQLLETDFGPVLVDTGPGSTLDTLTAAMREHGVAPTDLHAVLLTHIHFDHAGATGLLVEANPALRVFVHERGAPHLSDPSRLIASATRIYGNRMDMLWGRLLPVPPERMQVLRGGERIDFGDRRFDVLYTPGHAVHHVSFFEAATRTAYVGDTGGIRLPVQPHPLPVSPPPDFDLEAWLDSLDRIEAWAPERLFLTHYGFHDNAPAHFAALRRGLHDWTQQVRTLLLQPESDAARADSFCEHVMTSLSDIPDGAARNGIATFSDFRASFNGIARYWSKRALSE